MKESTNIELIRDAVQTHNYASFQEALDDMWLNVTEVSRLNDDDFAILKLLLKEALFLSFDGSWRLFWTLEQIWEFLTQSQKIALLPIIETIYPRLKDQQAQFLISELLGEYFADDTAMKTISRLRISAEVDDDGRALMAHALQHLLKTRPAEPLKTNAWQELLRMCEDKVEVVREEAKLALKISGTY